MLHQAMSFWTLLTAPPHGERGPNHDVGMTRPRIAVRIEIEATPKQGHAFDRLAERPLFHALEQG